MTRHNQLKKRIKDNDLIQTMQTKCINAADSISFAKANNMAIDLIKSVYEDLEWIKNNCKISEKNNKRRIL